MKTREEDFVAQLIIDSTHAYLLCFTNTGRVYWLKVYESPTFRRRRQGQGHGLARRSPAWERRSSPSFPVRDLDRRVNKYILFATRNGTVKKTALKDFSNVMARGIIAINIEKDDELIIARKLPMASRSSSSRPTTVWLSASTSRICDTSMGRPRHRESPASTHHAQEGRLRHRGGSLRLRTRRATSSASSVLLRRGLRTRWRRLSRRGR